MASLELLSLIEDLNSSLQYRRSYAKPYKLLQSYLLLSTLKQMDRRNEWTLKWNDTLEPTLTTYKMIGYSGFAWLNSLQMLYLLRLLLLAPSSQIEDLSPAWALTPLKDFLGLA